MALTKRLRLDVARRESEDLAIQDSCQSASNRVRSLYPIKWIELSRLRKARHPNGALKDQDSVFRLR